MKKTTKVYLVSVASVFAVMGAVLPIALGAQTATPLRHTSPSRALLLRRGKYIVDDVAMCGDCHTPHLQTGEPDMSKHLRGAPFDFTPIHPIPNLATQVPDITAQGLKGFTVEQVASILQGKRDNQGRPIPQFSPPMPLYQMHKPDALAVATYLMSLNP